LSAGMLYAKEIGVGGMVMEMELVEREVSTMVFDEKFQLDSHTRLHRMTRPTISTNREIHGKSTCNQLGLEYRLERIRSESGSPDNMVTH
jgi:hypothetical protein